MSKQNQVTQEVLAEAKPTSQENKKAIIIDSESDINSLRKYGKSFGITRSQAHLPATQQVEQALINVIKVGLYYRKPKNGKFMQSYKERVKKLHQAEEPEKYVEDLAQTIFPNERKYRQIMDDYKSWYGRDPDILNSIWNYISYTIN